MRGLLGLGVLIAAVAAGGGWLWRTIDLRLPAPLERVYQNVSMLPAQQLTTVAPETQLTIYYQVRGRALAPHTRRIPQPASPVERAQRVKDALNRPPASALFNSPLPTGASIEALFIVDGIVLIDIGKEFLDVNNPTPMRERLTIYGLVNSFLLNDPQNLRGVQVLIDGKPVQTAWGWLDLSSPLGPDLSLIR